MYPRFLKTCLLISILSFHNSKTMETYNQLQNYVSENEMDKLVELHKSNPIPFDKISPRGNTLLHIAAWHNSSEVAEFLLTHNTPTDVLNKNGDSALHIATRKGNIQTAYILLRYSANPSIKTSEATNKKSPLHIAASDGRNDMLKLLLHFGALYTSRDKNQNMPLHFAIEKNRQGCKKTLVQWGTDLQAKRRRSSSVTLLDKLGAPFLGKEITLNCQLISAIDEGEYKQMIKLLDQGAQINSQNNKGETPLHRAVYKGNRPMIFALLLRGADPTIKTSKDENPIHIALSHVFYEDPTERGISILHLLFKASSVTKDQFLNAIRSNIRKRAIHYLNYVNISDEEARFKSDTTFKDLIEATDLAGNNALHLAVLKGQSPKTVRMLLEYGVDPDKLNNDNKTPINLAVEIHGKSPNPVNSNIFEILTEEQLKDN